MNQKLLSGIYKDKTMPFTSVKDEMHKFKKGKLHSGSSKGPIVRNRKQAIAISLSEKKKAGGVDTGPSKKMKSKMGM